MTTRSASRRRPRRQLSGYLVLLIALAAMGGLYAAFAPSSRAADGSDQSIAIREGRTLFLRGCSTCHGLQAQGTKVAPSLIGVGAAAVDFQVSTGRMPLAIVADEADRKEPRYNPRQIGQLAAYIGQFGGPGIPSVNLSDGDLQEGLLLFRNNCAACHNFAGSGGALPYGRYAPPLDKATSQQVAEAIRTGPEQMPIFAPSTFSDHQVNSLARYVAALNEHKNPGGDPIGRFGPITEGLIAFVVGIGAMIGVAMWIGTRK